MHRVVYALSHLLLPALAATALCALLRCVPFDPTSYSAWTGIVLALLSLVALVKPSRWLWLPTRRWAGLALLAGLAIAAGALAWPPSVSRATGPHGPLDDFLPEYQALEHHEARTRAPLARVVEAMHQVSLADMPTATLLIQLRRLGAGPLRARPPERTPLLRVMAAPGADFFSLDDSDPKAVIYGMVGHPWAAGPAPRVHSPAEFRAFDTPGNVRVVFDIQAREEGAGVVRLTSETRILGTDPGARRNFQRYWRIVYPGSAIIRRVWLDAIVARAERPDL